MPIRDVRVLNPEVNRRDVEDKTVVLDLLVELDDGSRTNIEMQVEKLSSEPTLRDQAWHRQLAIDLHPIEMATIREETAKEKREAREEGLAEGRAEGLRAGLLALAEVLGVEIDAVRRDQLARMSADELQELSVQLRRTRSW